MGLPDFCNTFAIETEGKSMKTRIIMILLVGLMLISIGSTHAQETTPEPLPPQLEAQMAQLEAATATLRGLEILMPVTRAFPTRADTIAYLEDLYSRELPPDEMDRAKQLYVALGLLPADIDLLRVYLDLLGSQVAGFYDTDTQVMNVIPLRGDTPGATLSLTEQIIYVHEFTHALQDMHYDLDSLLPDDLDQTTPDRSLATTALVEGDASLIMQLYLQEVIASNPLAALSVLADAAALGALTLPPGIPDILNSELLFPYEQGLAFVTAIVNEGGIDALYALYDDPPTTTEQILHPEAYQAGEGAQPVTLGAVTPGADWTQLWDTTLGEFYVREHVALFAESRTLAAQAAAGWGGDALRIWQQDDQIAMLLKLAWDTPADADEFAAAYWAEAFTAACAEAEVGSLCAVTVNGETVIALAPDVETARALIAGV